MPALHVEINPFQCGQHVKAFFLIVLHVEKYAARAFQQAKTEFLGVLHVNADIYQNGHHAGVRFFRVLHVGIAKTDSERPVKWRKLLLLHVQATERAVF